ncbi:sigma factor G inhibitor Gin [Salipaludibacillus daqingensis]|uniref:sigma factor G inhibitor Gin n=1 Tax=Salipaludibacillus daqingensis TaxID=3041001 RepID=UPI0024751A5F|nr:sigma factor G inhibitor Gin [Salipaludibacillus daqingensis]
MRERIHEKKKTKDCLICFSSKNVGIHLQDFFICSDCEKKMVNAGVDDPHYLVYVHRLRRVRESLTQNKEGEVPK